MATATAAPATGAATTTVTAKCAIMKATGATIKALAKGGKGLQGED